VAGAGDTTADGVPEDKGMTEQTEHEGTGMTEQTEHEGTGMTEQQDDGEGTVRMTRHTNETARLRRRAFLGGAGATLVLVTGGGVWRAVGQGVFGAGTGPAFEPWDTWRAAGATGPLALVPAAILAANAHNTQPWLFRVGRARIDLFADTRRDIGAVDPFRREMYLSLGCALENLLLTAQAAGYGYRLTLGPDRSNPTHAARVDLSPGQRDVSPLYAAIPHRHTNRFAYDTSRPLPRATLDALTALGDNEPAVKVFWFATGAQRRAVGGLLVAAGRAMNGDTEQAYDNNARWVRQDQDAIERHRDGLTLDDLGLSGVTLLAAKMLPPPSLESAGTAWLQVLGQQARTAAAFGILAVRDDRDDDHRMRAGRLWQRMHLWGTAHGLTMQPMNQAHERADREAQQGGAPTFGHAVAALIDDARWRGVFSFRAGYPTAEAQASPRRAVTDVLI